MNHFFDSKSRPTMGFVQAASSASALGPSEHIYTPKEGIIMRKYSLMGLVVALIATMFSLASLAPASAETTPDKECYTSGSASNTEVKMEACSYAESSRSIDVTLQDRATASGQIQLSYFNPNATAWSKAKAMKCKAIYVSIKWSKTKIKRVVNNAKRKVNGTWCVRLKTGSTWANSGKNGNLVVPFTATVRGAWSLMTLKNVRKGIWGHKGEYRGGRFWQVCDNEWKIGLRPALKDTQVLMVRSEADVVYRNKTELVTNGAVKVEGSLNCPAGTLYGMASASASARDTLWIYVRASSAASAKIEAARRASANTAAWASLHVKAQQSQEVTAHAKIHLECSDTTPPKAVVSVDQLNDIDETDPNCEGTPQQCESWTVFQGHVTVPNGVSGTLRVESDYGTVKFTSNGTNTLSLAAGQHDPEIKFVAPTEVPAGGFATITITFTPTGGGEPVQAETKIRINETPTPPM